MSILSNGHQWKLTEFVDNKKYSFDRDQILNSLTSKDIDDAFNSISKWEGYSPTPLVNCLLYTSPSPRDVEESRMPSSA